MKILVTGGAGFIGSALIREIINNTNHDVLNVDKLTYAGNLASLQSVEESNRYQFCQLDINDKAEINNIIEQFQPTAIMHLAAESHVDRSLDGPAEFIQTNIVGTFNLLECARCYYNELSNDQKRSFRFQHISTDEVFGDLSDTGFFTENTPYDPSSPYSASKASSDHLVKAWHRSYGLPTLITNCSNNYGPYHFPEKLIPHMIINALQGKPLPIYGSGNQVRDWLFVEDHARALLRVLEKGNIGETYNIGGNNEHKNIEVVKVICTLLDALKPRASGSYTDQITHVKDRPGHDARYAIDATKIQTQLNWAPKETFETGLQKTVSWYLENSDWWQNILEGKYQLNRLGTGEAS